MSVLTPPNAFFRQLFSLLLIHSKCAVKKICLLTPSVEKPCASMHGLRMVHVFSVHGPCKRSCSFFPCKKAKSKGPFFLKHIGKKLDYLLYSLQCFSTFCLRFTPQASLVSNIYIIDISIRSTNVDFVLACKVISRNGRTRSLANFNFL